MEENRPNDIDKLFKDGLQPIRRKPSKAVWDNIEDELNKDDRRIFIVRLRFALLIGAGLLILVGGAEMYSLKKKMTSRDSSSGDLVQQSPAVIKDTAGKMVQLSLPAKQMEQAEPSRYVENDQEGGRVRVADIKDVLPAGSSRVDMPLQPIGSRAQIKTVAPAQRVLAVQPAMPKKASSLVALQRLRQWSVTAYYASELAGYSLTDQDSTAANGKEIDKKEKHVLSSSAVVLVNYQFSKHWGIETGLGYSWAKSHASPTTSYAVNNNGEIKFQVNTLSGYGYVPASSSSPAQVGDSVAVEHTTTTLHYLNAPFMLSYVLHFKKLTLMPGMGFSLNLLTGATLETRLRSASYVQQEYTVKMYGLKRLNYGMLLKTELAYAIDPHWSIDMVASFKNALTPINLHTVVATYPYNLGVGAGIKYSF
jgi:Outer membrane protein beta-barrel domain